ncbi:MAG: iron ABC transporter permease [Terriglobales bacterium]|jgi:iron complex transport system permease protein
MATTTCHQEYSVQEEIVRRSEMSRPTTIFAVLCTLLALLGIASLLFGRYSIPWHDWWQIIRSPAQSGTAGIVLLQVRLPRVLAAMLIGGGLSVSGAAFQGLFRNPMASPDILGATAGAGFGASLGILFGFGIAGIQLLGFVGGLVAVLLVWALAAGASRFGGDPTLTLILVGIIMREACMALIRLTEYIADPHGKLAAITFWLVGGLASINHHDLQFAALPILLGTVPLLLLRWRLNALSFGEEEAMAMGVTPWKMRVTIIVCSTLITAAMVSIAGMIMWVGLVIPHWARMIVGANHKVLLPASFLIGSGYLLLADDCARGLFALEVPLGILTSLVGAPFFLYLLFRARLVRQ